MTVSHITPANLAPLLALVVISTDCRGPETPTTAPDVRTPPIESLILRLPELLESARLMVRRAMLAAKTQLSAEIRRQSRVRA